MDTKRLFEFQDYRKYLEFEVRNLLGRQRGVKTRIAQMASIHNSYLTKILAGQVHLTLEQAFKVSKFLNHSHEQRKYFLFLVLKDRSDIPELKDFFELELHKFYPLNKVS